MFQFPSRTKVDQKFKISELLKMVKADKVIKTEAQNILSVQMTNAISQQTTGLPSSEEVNEIYVIKIELKDTNVPYEFIKALDKTIRFQVLFEIKHESRVKYLSIYKTITDEKIVQTKVFECDFQEFAPNDMPLVKNLTELYKEMLLILSGIRFRPAESIIQWLQRVNEIEKLQKEFTKYEKLANAEIQPKKKFEYNEILRKIYAEIKEKNNG